jgi:protein FAM32A
MPSEDYAVVGSGALKLKGSKVKKKKKKDKSDVAKALSTGHFDLAAKDKIDEARDAKGKKVDDEDRDDEEPVVLKTEAERRHEEARRKRVRRPLIQPFARRPYADEVLAAPSIVRILELKTRTPQDAQRTGRGTEHILIQAERTSRHAQDRSWLSILCCNASFYD